MNIKYLLLSCLLGLNSAIALAQDNNLISHDVGMHLNAFNDDGYFDFKSAEGRDVQDLGLGYDISVNYHFGNHFSSLPIFIPLFASVGWTHFDEYAVLQSSLCNDRGCTQTNSIQHDTLMLNIHYTVMQSAVADIDVYTGVSNVSAKGKINGDEWRRNAIGAQIGANFVFMPNSKIKPFVGLRLHTFEIEQDSHVAKIIDTSFLIGMRF